MEAYSEEQEHREVEHDVEAHPGPLEYATIASILTVVTAFEVMLYFISGMGYGTLVAMLMVLMVVKFVMVVGWYMHLKYDHVYFTYIFAGGLLVAITIVLAVTVIMNVFDNPDVVRLVPSGAE